MGRWDALACERSKSNGGNNNKQREKGKARGKRYHQDEQKSVSVGQSHQKQGSSSSKSLSALVNTLKTCQHANDEIIFSCTRDMQRILLELTPIEISSNECLLREALMICIDKIEIKGYFQLAEVLLQQDYLACLSNRSLEDSIKKLLKPHVQSYSTFGAENLLVACKLLYKFHKRIKGNMVERYLQLIIDTIYGKLGRKKTKQRREAYIECIRIVLSNPSLGATILTPTTLDVDDKGNEVVVPNSSRGKLESCLMSCLPESTSVFVFLLNFARQKNLQPHLSLDFSKIQVSIENELANKTNSKDVDLTLKFLEAIIQTFPSCFATMKSLLLSEQHVLTDGRLSSCGHLQRRSSVLMELLRSSRRNIGQIGKCCTLLLASFPLALWLDSRAIGSLQTHGQTVQQELINFIDIINCRFHDKVPDIHQVASKTLEIIPFPLDPNNSLTSAAMKLISTVVDSILLSSDGRRPYSNQETIDMLINWIGGTPLSQGGTSQMIAPLKCWLELDESQDFFRFLFDWNLSNHSDRCRILGAIVKSFCEIILDNADKCAAFQELVRAYMEHPMLQSHGLSLLENLALGKRASCHDDGHDITFPTLVFPCTNDMIISEKMTTTRDRLATLAIMSALQAADWSFAFNTGNGRAVLNAIVQSTRVECDQAEREAAFKALGEVLSNSILVLFFSSLLSDLDFLCNAAITVAFQGFDDDNARIRGMAFFMMGNLAIELLKLELSWPKVTTTEKMMEIWKKVISGMNDSNEKAAANAIRTVGHVGSLLLLLQDSGGNNSDADMQTMLKTTLQILKIKVNQSIHHNQVALKLTWKQRLAAKKHGWGACHALGLLLDSDFTVCHCRDLARESFLLLCQCAAAKDVHDKIILAALNAMKRLDQKRLLVLRSGLCGTAARQCLCALHSRINMGGANHHHHDRVVVALDSTLKYFIDSLSTEDAVTMLKQGLACNEINFLHDWMTEMGTSATSFSSISDALQSGDYGLDVRIEQRFQTSAKSATRIYLIAEPNQENMGADDEDSDQDEL